MMSYLLDTNHCIYLLNGWKKKEVDRKPEERNVVNKVFSLRGKRFLYMSEATLGELYYGAYLSARQSYNLERIEFLKQSVFPLAGSERAWKIFGKTKAMLKSNGKHMSDMDLFIAATAKEYGLTLVTGDAHHHLLPPSFDRRDWATSA
jgi:tRNA(fMet)-specific endonuclease VapC